MAEKREIGIEVICLFTVKNNIKNLMIFLPYFEKMWKDYLYKKNTCEISS